MDLDSPDKNAVRENSPAKIKVGILGLNHDRDSLLLAVESCDHMELAAVSDEDLALAERIGQKHNCPSFNDYRQLITQTKLDCIIVAEGLYRCEEYVISAIKKKCHILKLSPPATNFEQTAMLIQLAIKNDVIFETINPYQFSATFRLANDLLQQDTSGKIFLIEAVCHVTSEEKNHWSSDVKLSGGGVLLHNGYKIIDQIITNFGLPQQIYAATISHAIDHQQRQYSTEDTAIAMMKFNETLSCNITVTRSIETKKDQVKLFSKNQIVTVTADTLCITKNPDNNIQEKTEIPYSLADAYKGFFNQFAERLTDGLAEPDKKNRHPNIADLNNMAVIEAAYLSSRTSMPEEPYKFLQMQTNSQLNLWP